MSTEKRPGSSLFSMAVLRGLRIMQAQVNPYHPTGRYVVDLEQLAAEDPGFLADLRAAWDWMSRRAWEAESAGVGREPGVAEQIDMREYKRTLEQRRAQSQRMRERWQDPGFREQMRQRRLGKRQRSGAARQRIRFDSPEASARRSELMRERWQDPEWRKKTLESRKAARRRRDDLKQKHTIGIIPDAQEIPDERAAVVTS